VNVNTPPKPKTQLEKDVECLFAAAGVFESVPSGEVVSTNPKESAELFRRVAWELLRLHRLHGGES